MSTFTIIPQGTYPAGTYPFGPATVPAGADNAVLSLDGTAMTSEALHVNLSLDFSLDGGTTWASDNPGPDTNPYPIAMSLTGGQRDRDGSAQAAYAIGCNLPNPASSTRRMRGVAVVSGAALTTVGTLTLTP